MTMRTIVLAVGLFLMGPIDAQEETAAGEETGPWSGKVLLGFLATDGNTESSSLNTGFEIGYASGNWVHGLDGRAIHSTQESNTIAEAYELGWKTEYDFSANSFAFGRVDWRKDRFSGYDQQISQTAGYGRRIIDAAAHVLNGEVGVGARQLDVADGTSEDEVIFRGGLDYTWTFSETAQFTQDVVVESGDANTYLESVTAIKTTLIGDLALVASYTIKNNSEVPAGTEETDTYSALSLEYAF